MSVGFRIYTKVNRPDKALVAKFKGMPVANIGDEMNRFACMDAGIRPLNDTPMLGTAFTVRARAGDNLVLHCAIDMAEPGDVIVVDAGGDSTNALAGEHMIMWAQRRGIAGLIVDGAVRDASSIRGMNFPCYARYIQPNGPYKNGPGEINVPISCGHQVVHPGDIIVGDADGVIVISPADAQSVVEKAARKLEREIAAREAIVSGTWNRAPYSSEVLQRMGCEIIDGYYPIGNR